MKVYVQVIDTKTDVYQFCMIEEPVKAGLEIENALMHLGITYGHVIWKTDVLIEEITNSSRILSGHIEGTSKIVTVVSKK